MKNENKSPGERLLFPEIEAESVQHIETISDDRAEKVVFETVDFSDPNRPKTCLEVDFPILKVNEIAAIETNATKPIYMMSKWWARRRSSVFRQLLIAAATKAPKNEQDAAQLSWSLMYRKNHQKHGKFKGLKVVDIFMGGGTTVVEASRLGFDVTGVDLNPIAWWVVHNETHPVPAERVRKFAEYIEKEVRPQIMPFFSARSPRGFQGQWVDINTGKIANVDPTSLSYDQRKQYDWKGPEVIYTFWLKHIMCSDPSCCHLTPQVNSSVVANKSVKMKFWADCVCPNPKCGQVFDLEQANFRMAPLADFVLGTGERAYAAIEPGGQTKCPHCKQPLAGDWVLNTQERKGRPISKEIIHHLLLSKEWLNGITAPTKEAFGGYHGALPKADKDWYDERSKNLHLIEVRGNIPKNLEHSNFAQKKKKDSEEEKSSGNLICGKCGRAQEPLVSIKATDRLAPTFPFMVQGVDPEAKQQGYAYGGRFFDLPDTNKILAAIRELGNRDDIKEYIPNEELWFGHETHQRQLLPQHGYSHWYKMFNPRQLYVHALLLKTISDAPESMASNQVKSHAFGAFQNYLRHNCMFTIWNLSGDKIEPHFSNNNYHPKASAVENGVFSDLGRGNFASCIANVAEGLDFAVKPYDLRVSREDETGKSSKEESNDGVLTTSVKVLCQSSTNLSQNISDSSVDLVITDPPFGDNLNYSELADFFLVWLQKPLSKIYPDIFQSSESPKRLEAIANKARQPGETENGLKKADVEYDRLLTMCWKEAYRVLKPGGLMAFTFHHDKDIAWIGVLESLFKAGFIIECAFPIRSDSTKGDGDFGSKKIEFDIVHVCRKRLSESKDIYWATLRKKIIESVASRRLLLEQHYRDGLGLADLEVIIRGEVLEQFSKHYGKVKKNLAGDLMSVKEILIEAGDIARNLLTSDKADRLPDAIGPETRVYFWLFRDGPAVEFNQAKLRLKGYGISVEDLAANDWLKIERQDGKKIVRLFEPVDRWNSLARKKSLKSDLDQVHFAINCFVERRTNSDDRTDLEKWVVENIENLYPSVVPILQYMEKTHFGSAYQLQLAPALRAIERGLAKAKQGKQEIKGLFD
jgi:putative DNA methylase